MSTQQAYTIYIEDAKHSDARRLAQNAAEVFEMPLDAMTRDYRQQLTFARSVRYLPLLLCAFALSAAALLSACSLFVRAALPRAGEDLGPRRLALDGLQAEIFAALNGNKCEGYA
jgi:hypothetical protein